MRVLMKAIMAVVLTPVILLIAGIGGCEATKGYYDWQVRRMCEKDGGITVYEHITVSPEVAASMDKVGGQLAIPNETLARSTDPAFLRGRSEILREGNPSVRRLEQTVVRSSDGKTVARMISYARAGGDFPFTVSNPTVVSCPDWPQYYRDIAKVFVIKREQ
jgi:hypothetical protein